MAIATTAAAFRPTGPARPARGVRHARGGLAAWATLLAFLVLALLPAGALATGLCPLPEPAHAHAHAAAGHESGPAEPALGGVAAGCALFAGCATTVAAPAPVTALPASPLADAVEHPPAAAPSFRSLAVRPPVPPPRAPFAPSIPT